MPDQIHPIPAFTDNYIWALIDSKQGTACVVDPGDAGPVYQFLESAELHLTEILITHHHPDHTGGLRELIAAYSPRVYGPHNKNISGISHRLSENDEIEVMGQRYAIMEVPGHTLDHIAYFCADAKPPILFCGDTLFAAGCGRLFEGTPEIMHRSLAKLRALPGATRVYCTHEYTLANLKFARAADPDNPDLSQRIPLEEQKRQADKPTLPSSMTLELATNPFLRCSDPVIIARLEQQQGLKLDNEVAVFAALRQWKDNF